MSYSSPTQWGLDEMVTVHRYLWSKCSRSHYRMTLSLPFWWHAKLFHSSIFHSDIIQIQHSVETFGQRDRHTTLQADVKQAKCFHPMLPLTPHTAFRRGSIRGTVFIVFVGGRLFKMIPKWSAEVLPIVPNSKKVTVSFLGETNLWGNRHLDTRHSSPAQVTDNELVTCGKWVSRKTRHTWGTETHSHQ